MTRFEAYTILNGLYNKATPEEQDALNIAQDDIQFMDLLGDTLNPVRHGRWIDTREYCGDFMCSNCEALYGTNKFNYCPACGAKMDEEE